MCRICTYCREIPDRLKAICKECGLHQISHCWMADLAGEKGTPALEDDEIAHGFEAVWMDLNTAIEAVAAERGIDDYESRFIQMRDLRFLQEVKKSILQTGEI